MIETRKLLLALSKRFPKKLAKKYQDYVGLMCGKLPQNISKIFLSLDMDELLLPLVLEQKPDLVMTHHPFIYGTRHKVLSHDEKRLALVNELEAKNIPVYSLHTNFDEGRDGMNDALAKALGLINVKPLQGALIGRGGYLSTPMKVKEFALYAKKTLHAKYGLLIANGKQTITSVAIIGGGGSQFYSVAQKEGFDIYISGDAPHHVRRGVVNDHYNYLDLPHEIESIFIPQMKKILLEIDPSLLIVTGPLQELPEII
jgi:dinuclear metal center YbgI/SA1388 family protein